MSLTIGFIPAQIQANAVLSYIIKSIYCVPIQCFFLLP